MKKLTPKIQALLNYTNEITGTEDTTLGEAIKTLCTNYSNNENKSKWTGHVDEEGLRAIGWTDSDIEYFRVNGLCWNEEEDEEYKVSQYIKDEYNEGKITYNTFRNYQNTMDYMPRIADKFKLVSGRTFQNFYYLKGIPCFDFSESTYLVSAFTYCYTLLCLPPLDLPLASDFRNAFFGAKRISKVTINAPLATNVNAMFRMCYALKKVDLTFGALTDVSYMFQTDIHLEEVSNLNFSSVTTFAYFFQEAASVKKFSNLDFTKFTTNNLITSLYNLEEIKNVRLSANTFQFTTCYKLREVENLGPFYTSFDLSNCQCLTHQSLINIINELETVTTSQKLTLGGTLLAKLTDSEKQIAINKGWTLA